MHKAREYDTDSIYSLRRSLFNVCFKHNIEIFNSHPSDITRNTQKDTSYLLKRCYDESVKLRHDQIDYNEATEINDPLIVLREIDDSTNQFFDLCLPTSLESEFYSFSLSPQNYEKLISQFEDDTGPVKHLQAPLGGLKGGAASRLPEKPFNKTVSKKNSSSKKKDSIDSVDDTSLETEQDLVKTIENIQQTAKQLQETLDKTLNVASDEFISKNEDMAKDPIFAELLDVYPGIDSEKCFPSTSVPPGLDSSKIEILSQAVCMCKRRIDSISEYREYIHQKLNENPVCLKQAHIELAGERFPSESQMTDAITNSAVKFAVSSVENKKGNFPNSAYLKHKIFSNAADFINDIHVEQDKKCKYRSAQRTRAELSLNAIEAAIDELNKKKLYITEILPILKSCEEAEQELSDTIYTLLQKARKEVANAQLQAADYLTNPDMQTVVIEELGRDLTALNSRELAIKKNLLDATSRILIDVLNKEP